MKRVVIGLLLAAVAVYTLPALVFWAAQDSLVFPAPTVASTVLADAARAVGAEPVQAMTEDGIRLYGWHRIAPRAPTTPRSVVLYFHGNAETVDGRWDLQELALANGQDFVVFAYRGYPGSEGTPSEKGLHADARAAWRFVTNDLGVPPERIIIHGKSLGGGVAAGLAAEVHPKALVLESTFTSISSIVRGSLPVYPIDLLLRHPFHTDRLVGSITAPTLILHGDADSVIPVEHGRALHKAMPAATYVEVPGVGHAETLPVVFAGARTAWIGLLQ